MIGRRRGALRTALALPAALAVLVAGCDGGGPVAAGDDCAAPEQPTLQGGGHLIGDTPPPVPYSSNPPTSGWHTSGRPPLPGVYEAPLPAPALVSVLEHGGVVVAHGRPLTPTEQAAVAELLATDDRLVVTPWTLDDGDPPVTLVAWGTLQRCDRLVPDAVTAFVAAHGGSGEGH